MVRRQRSDERVARALSAAWSSRPCRQNPFGAVATELEYLTPPSGWRRVGLGAEPLNCVGSTRRRLSPLSAVVARCDPTLRTCVDDTSLETLLDPASLLLARLKILSSWLGLGSGLHLHDAGRQCVTGC